MGALGDVDEPFDLAILYWFYRDPAATRNHLELLRAHNPGRRIYGLYGGSARRRAAFDAELYDLLDDFWEYPGTWGSDEYTKWMHGDLLILDWYDRRGRFLAWDSIAVVQWDMLLFADVAEILPGLRAGQLFFSGYRDIDADLERWWEWIEIGRPARREYLRFRRSIVEAHGWTGPMKCCMWVFEVLTRPFLDGYLGVADKRLGMLEYKNPTLAAVLGLDVHVADIGLYWDDRPAPLLAGTDNITRRFVETELARPGGWRMFHPYKPAWPDGRKAGATPPG